jgi:hypothetical protein
LNLSSTKVPPNEEDINQSKTIGVSFSESKFCQFITSGIETSNIADIVHYSNIWETIPKDLCKLKLLEIGDLDLTHVSIPTSTKVIVISYDKTELIGTSKAGPTYICVMVNDLKTPFALARV